MLRPLPLGSMASDSSARSLTDEHVERRQQRFS